MIKKSVAASLFIFWAVTVSILTSALVSYEINNSNGDMPTGNVVKLSFEPNLSKQDSKGGDAFSILDGQEVARHSIQNDCWLIISYKIYDITNYIPFHPGGIDTILPYCGKDATAAFSGHSKNARNMLDKYYVGDLGQQTNPNTQNNQTTTNKTDDNKTASGQPISDLPVNTPPIFNNTPPSTIPQNPALLTIQEVANHNSQNNCWMVISNKIYDITKYIPYHPGGPNTITPYCGKDATIAFSGHSSNAKSMLSKYYIGDLGQLPNTQPINTQPSNDTQPLLNNTPPIIIQPPNNTQPALNNTPPPTVLPPSNNTNGQNITYILTSEVAIHNTQNSCWMVISNKVYDVTRYIPYHPGGSATIISYCGKDATIAFSGHSSNAQALLSSYYKGELGQPTTQPPVINPPANNTQPPSTTRPPVINPPYDEDEEEEDD